MNATPSTHLREGGRDRPDPRAIYPAAAAARMQAHAGKPYRPSNGSEGSYFESAWCADCRRLGGEDSGCRVLMLAMAHSTRDPEYPAEWVYGADGQPCCTAFSDKHAPRPAYRCRTTDDLFAGDLATGSPADLTTTHGAK